MAPKKKEQLKMSLGDFMNDTSFGGSWADEVEDDIMTGTGTQAFPMSERRGGYGNSSYSNDRGYNSYGNNDRGSDRYAGYSRQTVSVDIPDKPPYTAHLGNLSWEITQDAISEFFAPFELASIRIIEDRETQRPKGFAYAEFATREGLEKALLKDGIPLQGRPMRIKVAEVREGQDNRHSNYSSGRDLDWTRKGPLDDLPSQRPTREFQERRPREPVEDRGIRDLGTWERKGPLPPREEPERENSRPPRQDSFRSSGRRENAAWGEGRQNNQDGSRPPRPERVPTAAERDSQWRNNMRPDSAAGEAPTSPAAAPTGRRRLNLTKRTITDTDPVASPTTTSKSNPFGGARPIDTAAREREVEEKLAQAAKAKKEAEEKAREEARLAKEAEEKAAAEKAEAEAKAAEAKAAEAKAAEVKAAEAKAAEAKAAEAKAAEAKAAEAKAAEAKVIEAKAANPEVPATSTAEASAEGAVPQAEIPAGQRGPRREPREPREHKPSRAAESGNWRSSGGPRGGPANGPRRGDGRGLRGGPRGGPRRDFRGEGSVPSTPVAETSAEGEKEKVEKAEKPKPDADGWTTVGQATRGRRGGR